jgi:hypothetical protein
LKALMSFKAIGIPILLHLVALVVCVFFTSKLLKNPVLIN